MGAVGQGQPHQALAGVDPDAGRPRQAVGGGARVRLSADTLARLRAAAETMGISADELAERCILDSLPTIEREDLLAIPHASEPVERMLEVRGHSLKELIR